MSIAATRIILEPDAQTDLLDVKTRFEDLLWDNGVMYNAQFREGKLRFMLLGLKPKVIAVLDGAHAAGLIEGEKWWHTSL